MVSIFRDRRILFADHAMSALRAHELRADQFVVANRTMLRNGEDLVIIH